MNEDILLDINDGVALITFNRSAAMNTFTSAMMIGLGDAYKECDANDDVRVVVTTGAGKAYCAGADRSGGVRDEQHRHQHADRLVLQVDLHCYGHRHRNERRG